MRNITSAQAQWFSRPEDERFESLQALHAAALADQQRSRSRAVPVADVRARAEGNAVVLNGKNAAARLTHWSFDQTARIAGAPSGYLRTLPAHLAADCLNHGFGRLEADARRSEHQLYFGIGEQHTPEAPDLTIKAITSTDYARIHDADIVARLIRVQESHPAWHLPTDWNQRPSGAFRGDRDMFVLMVDGGSIVEDPTIRTDSSHGSQDRAMFRGFILRNSEVGAASLMLQTFMFRFVCGNLCIWGAENVRTIRRRHVGNAQSIAYRLAEGIRGAELAARRPASADVNAIRLLNAHELGKDREEVITAGRAVGLSVVQATRSYEQAEVHEDNPRSVWGFAQGITRASQLLSTGYQDERLTMDQIAGQLLKKHAKVYA